MDENLKSLAAPLLGSGHGGLREQELQDYLKETAAAFQDQYNQINFNLKIVRFKAS